MSEYDAFADIYDFDVGRGLVEEDVPFYVAAAMQAIPPVLDLACGTGRVTLAIARAGVEVVGLDSSVNMIAQAQEKAKGLSNIRFVHGDMRDFSLEQKFGLAIISYPSFLHLTTPEDQRQALTNIRNHLLDSGALILSILNPTARQLAIYMGPTEDVLRFDHEFRHPGTGHVFKVWEQRRVDEDRQTIELNYIYDELDNEGSVRGRRYRSLHLRYVHRYEMQHLLELCGYDIEGLYGGYDGSPLHRYSPEMVWVARRD